MDGMVVGGVPPGRAGLRCGGRLAPPIPLRMVVTDLDGTLLRDNGALSGGNRQALAALVERGVEVVVATGRSVTTGWALLREAGLGGVAVFSNGALTYQLETQMVLDHRPIAREVAGAALSAIRDRLPEARFAAELGVTALLESGFPDRYPPSDGRRWCPAPLEAALGDDVTKFLVAVPDLAAGSIGELVAEMFAGVLDVSYATPRFAEVVRHGVNKASALDRWCRLRGIPSEAVVAVGDMPNDLEMLAWAGLGVAVANAHPSVLAAAGAITGANHEDGFAAMVERLLD